MTDNLKENTSGQGEGQSREIKFRAWDKIKNIMYRQVPFVPLTNENRLVHIQYEDGFLKCIKVLVGIPITQHWIDVKDFELMQYTGLKDKNGVEIYESDIVNIEDQDYTEKTLGIIQRAQGGFDIDRTMYGNNRGGHNLYFLSPYLMVIGNIYQNPELLSDK